jgi:superfamily II DNA or RNA helicase
LHAKIYLGDDAATVGSSNFTANGLGSQLEANARFSAGKEAMRYRELRNIAENFWQLGTDYSADLIDLLNKLLRVVTWEEALARACAELLEGNWADEYLAAGYLPGEGDLWPSQRQGIAQALYVLSRQGSALVADATGSGKTRMGVHLIRAAVDDIVRSGRLRRGKALMVCPPAVRENWELEATRCSAALDVVSHGSLSHAASADRERIVEALRRAQIVCVDEGHNFLNLGSNRTQELLRNMADHVLLFTATPINRSVTDLLRIADMLGADNLESSTLQAFKKMLGVNDIHRTLTEPEIDALRREIQKFTVRRTKRMLNELIDENPSAFVDAKGRPCRFPTHQPNVYLLNEPQHDRDRAAQIQTLADKLFAVTHFVQPFEMPDALKKKGWSEESFLAARLGAAKKIAHYQIMASLRSSRAALVEHVAGTDRARESFGLKDFSKYTSTGNQLQRLARIQGRPPQNKLSIPLPDWLRDRDLHAEACESDRKVYAEILELVEGMSDSRERTKAAHLVSLAERHPMLLAFDSRPITLAQIRHQIKALAPAQTVLIATGDPRSERGTLLDKFKPGDSAASIMGLCSDSMAEGVNLQQASCMVHLDMPSVVRIAEQRAGRVDRMDSPHDVIEAWWPEDAPEFALSSDERFISRYETVEALLGSNMPLPERMQTESKPVTAKALIEEYERDAEPTIWDGIHDAFEPVRSLVRGERALIDRKTYSSYRSVTTRVLSRVSVVAAHSPWAFFSLAGGSFRAPHWVFFPMVGGPPITDLAEVCEQLRRRVNENVQNLPMDQRVAQYLDSFVKGLSNAERGLLSRRKQRALEEMRIVLESFAKAASSRHEQESVEQYEAILAMLKGADSRHQPDWDEVASRWLDLIRPIWYERLKQRRNKPLLLKHIRRDLQGEEDRLRPAIFEQFRTFPLRPSPDERISAAIVGVSS